MRSEPTPGEAALWARLQGRALSGWRFRRQHVIAGYIVDFYCPKLWLAIEVDGPIHDVQREQDERRDLHLAALGVHVLRIRDENIQANLIDVLRAISARCEGLAINANVHAYGGRTSKR
jgi:very-short-patch-repair endonuclease